MIKNLYEGLNARPKVYLSKEYFCKIYPTCVSSKLCEFISFEFIASNLHCLNLMFRWHQQMLETKPPG